MFIYGLILLSWAMGNIVGILLVNRLKTLKRLLPENLYFFFTAVMASGMIAIFQTSLLPVIVITALFAGIGDGTYQTYFTTYIQQVPDEVRGKIFGLAETILKTGFGLGFVAVPLVLNILPVSQTVICFHGPALIIIAAFFLKKTVFGEKRFITLTNKNTKPL
jgi:predicted MFS family arabinose efflux permease